MLKQNAISIMDQLVERYPVLVPLHLELLHVVEAMAEAYRQGNKIMICGNGGSAADSLHIVGELLKSFMLRRMLPQELQEKLRKAYGLEAEYYIENLQQAIPAISLVSEMSLFTAYGNDNAPDLVFAQQVLGQGNPGDVLIAISTSGNSVNVLHAARIAKILGVSVVSMTGQTGGKLREYSDFLLAVPEQEAYRVQELHLPIYHAICLALEQELFAL